MVKLKVTLKSRKENFEQIGEGKNFHTALSDAVDKLQERGFSVFLGGYKTDIEILQKGK